MATGVQRAFLRGKKIIALKSPCFEAGQLGLLLHSQLLGSLVSQVLGVGGSERPKPAAPLPTDQLWKKPNSQTLLLHGHAHKPQFPHRKLIVASPALQNTLSVSKPVTGMLNDWATKIIQ